MRPLAGCKQTKWLLAREASAEPQLIGSAARWPFKLAIVKYRAISEVSSCTFNLKVTLVLFRCIRYLIAF